MRNISKHTWENYVGMIAVIGTGTLLAVSLLFFHMANDSSIKKSEEELVATAAAALSSDREQEYYNPHYGFSFSYPEEFVVTEMDEGAGATSMAFEDSATARGFQVFVVPYTESQIHPERFHKDIPSGVREDPTDTYIDGVLANAFYSHHHALGETYEVWFIHDGYLFELTTLRPLEDVLIDVVDTWTFL